MPKRAAAHTGEFNEQGICNAYVVFAEKQSVKKAQEMNMKMVRSIHGTFVGEACENGLVSFQAYVGVFFGWTWGQTLNLPVTLWKV